MPSDSENVVHLPVPPSDSEVASAIRKRLCDALREVCWAVDEAKRHNMRIEYGIGNDSFGRSIITVPPIFFRVVE